MGQASPPAVDLGLRDDLDALFGCIFGPAGRGGEALGPGALGGVHLDGCWADALGRRPWAGPIPAGEAAARRCPSRCRGKSRAASLADRARREGCLGCRRSGNRGGDASGAGRFQSYPNASPISGLPKEFDGYKIVQVSDIHVGPTIKGSFVDRMVDEINAQGADLVAITGDLVDGSLKHLSDHVRRLSNIKSKDGSFFVTGNHEYYSGAQVWVDFVESLGIKPLMNEHQLIERGGQKLVLAGVTDYAAHRHLPEHRSDVAAALKGADPSLTKILLAHQPRSVFEAADKGIDLQLSGHTHNGQMFPFNFFVAMAQPYLKGLAKVVESSSPMWIYVHQGTGYWGPPNRLGIPPEVAVLTLRAV